MACPGPSFAAPAPVKPAFPAGPLEGGDLDPERAALPGGPLEGANSDLDDSASTSLLSDPEPPGGPPNGTRQGAPSATLFSLLAQLGSQQQRLQQLSEDIASTLLAVGTEAASEQGLPEEGSLPLPPEESRPPFAGPSRVGPPTDEHPCSGPPAHFKRCSDGASLGLGSGSDSSHAAESRRSRGSLGSGPLPQGVTDGTHPSAQVLLEGLSEQPWKRLSTQLSLALEDSAEGSDGERGSVGGAGGHCVSRMWSEEGPAAVRRNAVSRLQARLGKQELGACVTAQELYRSVSALGLVKYSLADLERWLERLNDLIGERPRVSGLAQAMARVRPGALSRLSSLWSREHPGCAPQAVPSQVLAELLLDDASICLLEAEFQEMCLIIREVLFSGDANRLVAELTNLGLDEVAGPNERPDALTMLEPVVAIAIVLNGVFIGIQSSSAESSGQDGWFWANCAFTAFFVAEIGLRAFVVGLRDFFGGPDRYWNFFDLSVIATAVFDIIVEVVQASTEVAPLAVVRILRLTRLPRLIRIFRLRQMRELTLMIRGLLGGFKTLFWAVVLLFFTIYMVACLLTSTVGRAPDPVPEIASDNLLSSVPQAFLTCFRCFMGDCNTSDGRPIVKLLVDRYGAPFALSYGAVMTFVMLGLFNLIIAIYIENTLVAAKTEGERTKAQRHRESVRVARLTRQLLKKFCALHRQWRQTQDGDAREVKRVVSQATFMDLGNAAMRVSKEMFLSIVADSSVQQLMDDLDIPDERGALFDILDADGSGDLEVVELITGLLRVRGEAKKSDVLGTLLAVRAVQGMLRAHQDQMESLDACLRRFTREKAVLEVSRSAKFRDAVVDSKLSQG